MRLSSAYLKRQASLSSPVVGFVPEAAGLTTRSANFHKKNRASGGDQEKS